MIYHYNRQTFMILVLFTVGLPETRYPYTIFCCSRYLALAERHFSSDILVPFPDSRNLYSWDIVAVLLKVRIAGQLATQLGNVASSTQLASQQFIQCLLFSCLLLTEYLNLFVLPLGTSYSQCSSSSFSLSRPLQLRQLYSYLYSQLQDSQLAN